MLKQLARFAVAVALTLTCQEYAMAEQAGHVTGVGGVFVKSKDPKALAKWYSEVLGLEVKPWGGAALPFDAPGHPPKVSWTAFPDTSNYMSPSTREFMINFAVDDMDAIIARLTAHGVPILKRDDNDAFGRFAWIQDPDGTRSNSGSRSGARPGSERHATNSSSNLRSVPAGPFGRPLCGSRASGRGESQHSPP